MDTQTTAAAPRRRGPAPRVFTEAVLAMIPIWVVEGATRIDIAKALNTTVGTLEVACSKHGISLKTGGSTNFLERRLGREPWAEVRRQAQRRGITPAELVVKLVAAAAGSKIIDGILDDAGDLP